MDLVYRIVVVLFVLIIFVLLLYSVAKGVQEAGI